jgi:hypothetical protein
MRDEQRLRDALEGIVDGNTLAAVVDALAAVCRDKAEHIRSAWQDWETARAWDRAAKVLEAAAGKIDV